MSCKDFLTTSSLFRCYLAFSLHPLLPKHLPILKWVFQLVWSILHEDFVHQPQWLTTSLMEVAYLTFGPSHTVHLKKFSFKECSPLHGQKGYLRRQLEEGTNTYLFPKKVGKRRGSFFWLEMRREKRNKLITSRSMDWKTLERQAKTKCKKMECQSGINKCGRSIEGNKEKLCRRTWLPKLKSMSLQVGYP